IWAWGRIRSRSIVGAPEQTRRLRDLRLCEEAFLKLGGKPDLGVGHDTSDIIVFILAGVVVHDHLTAMLQSGRSGVALSEHELGIVSAEFERHAHLHLPKDRITLHGQLSDSTQCLGGENEVDAESASLP